MITGQQSAATANPKLWDPHPWIDPAAWSFFEIRTYLVYTAPSFEYVETNSRYRNTDDRSRIFAASFVRALIYP